MNVTPYSDPLTGKKEQVEKMFNNISGKYDFLNRSLSAGTDIYWRKKIADELKEMKPQHILDIATGTADVAITLARLNPKKITGIDLSEGMLEIGRKKVTEKKLDSCIWLEKGDAENLQFPDNYFDAVTVAFGVRNFENLPKGLSEIYRVLKPGGKLLILEFSKPKKFPVKQIFDFYFKYYCPWWGKLVSKDASAYTYLYESVKSFPEGNDFLHILEKTGLKKLQAQRLTFGIASLYAGYKSA